VLAAPEQIGVPPLHAFEQLPQWVAPVMFVSQPLAPPSSQSVQPGAHAELAKEQFPALHVTLPATLGRLVQSLAQDPQ